MGYESYRICDECGKRQNIDKKKDMKKWLDVDVYPNIPFRKKSKARLDVVVCGMKCAKKCLQRWLDEQSD